MDEVRGSAEPIDVVVCGVGRLGGALLDPLRDAVKTADGSLSGHIEHMLVITRGKPVVLTV